MSIKYKEKNLNRSRESELKLLQGDNDCFTIWTDQT